jgi:hypothetical protein
VCRPIFGPSIPSHHHQRQAAVALHFAHYNLVRLHKTLRVTPAMAANVTDRIWSLEELVERTSK